MSYRRHTRVRRRSRYAEWLLDAFGSDTIEGWALDEPAGATEFTGFKQGKTATINGGVALQQGSLVGGVRGSAQFDGSSSEAVVGDDADFDFGDGEAFSVVMWIKRGPVNLGSSEFLISKRDSSSSYEGWIMRLQSDGDAIEGAVEDGSNNKIVLKGNTTGATGGVSNGAPRKIGMTWDGSTLKLYLDGAEDGSETNNNFGTLKNATELVLGRADSGTAYYAGKMQYPTVFSRVLTSDEMTAIYEQGAEFFDRGRLL